MNFHKILTTARTVGIKGLYLAKKHKPEILMIASGVSGLACVFFTRKAALKEGEILENHKERREKVEKIITTEKFYIDNPKKARRLVTNVYAKTGWEPCKAYGPAVAFGLSAGVMGAMGFLVEKKRTENMKAALATALAAQKKFMEGRDTTELPSADNTDSSKEGESSETEVEEKVPPLLKYTGKECIFFGPGSPLWADPLREGDGANIARLKYMQEYFNIVGRIQGVVYWNDICQYLYKNKRQNGKNAEVDKPDDNNVPRIGFTHEDGKKWGWLFDPDNPNDQIDFGINHLSNDTLCNLMARDGGIYVKFNGSRYIGEGVCKK
jgi:hypothetical protein